MDGKEIKLWSEPSAFLARATIYVLAGFLNGESPALAVAECLKSELVIMPADVELSRRVLTETIDFQGQAILKLLNYRAYSQGMISEYSDYVILIINSLAENFDYFKEEN
jgi:hypothetical protein